MTTSFLSNVHLHVEDTEDVEENVYLDGNAGDVFTPLTSFLSFPTTNYSNIFSPASGQCPRPPEIKFSPKEEIQKRKLIQIAETDTKGLLTDETCEEGSVSKSEHKAAIPSPESSALNTIECSSCPLKFGNKSY